MAEQIQHGDEVVSGDGLKETRSTADKNVFCYLYLLSLCLPYIGFLFTSSLRPDFTFKCAHNLPTLLIHINHQGLTLTLRVLVIRVSTYYKYSLSTPKFYLPTEKTGPLPQYGSKKVPEYFHTMENISILWPLCKYGGC